MRRRFVRFLRIRLLQNGLHVAPIIEHIRPLSSFFMSRITTCLAALLILMPIASGKACSCGPQPPDFLTDLRNVLQNYHSNGKDLLLVTKGVITGLTANRRGVIFKPLNIYYGKPLRDTVIIWGTDGTDCRLGVVGLYKLPADTFIFLMNRNTGRDYLYEDTADFHISACGNATLKIRNDSVFGGRPGTFAFAGFPLDDFERDSLSVWLHALRVEPEQAGAFDARLFPNPVSAGVMLQLQGVFSEDVSMAICDVSGKVLVRLSNHGHGSSKRIIPIALGGFHDGLYFLQIISPTRRRTMPFTVSAP